ncbi:MAG: cupin domain-containing protein [Acidimicrobiales bacterium]
MTSLARCVGDAEGFLDRHWARAPLHRRGADRSAFADLFSLADVDHLVSSTSPRLPSLRLVRDGRPLDAGRYTRTAQVGGRPVSGMVDPRRVFEELAGGATIVLQGLQRQWAPLARFCRSLERELTHAVQANAYVTPPQSRGLGVHYDTHDVFVLQLAGRKAWEIRPPVLADPLPSQPWTAGRLEASGGEPGVPCLTADLGAGDCLYVPRGFLHSAAAQEELSAHLTIGVNTTTRHDVVRLAMAGAADDAAFRAALAPGWAEDDGALAADVEQVVKQLRDWLDTVDARAVAVTLSRRFWSARPPLLAGQLAQLLALDEISDRTRVRRREGTVCRVLAAGMGGGPLGGGPEAAVAGTAGSDGGSGGGPGRDGGRGAGRDGGGGNSGVSVLLGDRELRMPAALAPVLGDIAAGEEPFAVADLSDRLDGPSRLVLVRRLVREGLLEMVD